MSRVVFTDTPTTADQESLRTAHDVRLVEPAEEGFGVDALPAGVYGFTYAPGLVNAPLFAQRRYRSYEIHKLKSGEVFIVAFASPDAPAQLATATADVALQLLPEPDPSASTLVAVPYSRIRRHRQYAAPNQHGFTVTVAGR